MDHKYNYYEINLYCKNEGLNTDYFITHYDEVRKHGLRRFLGFLISTFA